MLPRDDAEQAWVVRPTRAALVAQAHGTDARALPDQAFESSACHRYATHSLFCQALSTTSIDGAAAHEPMSILLMLPCLHADRAPSLAAAAPAHPPFCRIAHGRARCHRRAPANMARGEASGAWGFAGLGSAGQHALQRSAQVSRRPDCTVASCSMSCFWSFMRRVLPYQGPLKVQGERSMAAC